MNSSGQLALSILDGPHKGKVLSLKKGFVFKSDFFSDEEMGGSHAEAVFDHNISWNINALGGNRIRIGSGEVEQISLIFGLVFHLGQTGFKVVEKQPLKVGDWEATLISWLEKQNWNQTKTDFFLFSKPIRMTILSGPQADEFFTISYGPRTMGFNNLDLNITDPSLPKNIVRFFQVGESAFVENLIGGLASDKVLVNKNRFDQHIIADGDRLQFGAHLIEFTILK
jgi:hypothetical protein